MIFKSPQQKRIYNYIITFFNEYHYCPSYEEIAEGLELNSVATIWQHIKNLQEQGLIIRNHNDRRKYELTLINYNPEIQESFPQFKCHKCGAITQLDFNPIKNNKKFTNFKCPQCQNN